MPTGSTRVQAEDRMLLVGDPEILPYIGEKLRLGVPDFPLRHGPNIVVYQPRGPDPALEAPVRVLADKTRAVDVVRLQPSGGDLEEHVREILANKPGLLVVRPAARSILDRLTGRGGRATRLCNLVPVPILFLGSGAEPQRVVLATESHQELRTADTAIDLARLLSLPLALLQLEMPAYLVGDNQRDRIAASLQQRAGLYGLRTTTEIRVGNPVAQALAFLGESDLCVVARRRTVRDGFTSPDVALRIARAGRAATLVVTV
jgi:hypothetical protein